MSSEQTQKQPFFTRHRLFVKGVFIWVLISLLCIPIALVNSLIDERLSTKDEASVEICSKWGSEQTIIAPILSIDNNDSTLYEKQTILILPQELNIDSKVNTQTLKRGMYDIVVYTTDITLSGRFELPNNIYNDGKFINNSGSHINVKLTDLRGLTKNVELDFGGTNSTLSSDGDGVRGAIDLQTFVRDSNKVDFTITLNFNGSQALQFAPLGNNTNITMSSNYTTPSFDGAFLPQSRNVTDSGFQASWSVMSTNRSYPQLFLGNYSYQSAIEESLLGVNLLPQVDQYLQATRAVKYAFLIIILTFALSFFIEMVQKKNIHPLQYVLIGLALCLFYTLLVSISEYLGFGWAYLISAVMTVSLITLYMVGVLQIKKTALTIGGVLAGLYGYIYTLIQMESYALLTGSIGLFVILATIMYFSLKIKWNDK